MSRSRYDSEVDFDSALDLYEAVGWRAYTKNPNQLKAALFGSSLVLTFKVNGKIVGLVRCLSDGQEKQMKFYEKLGFEEMKNDLRGFVLQQF